jgi:hypothetical protein
MALSAISATAEFFGMNLQSRNLREAGLVPAHSSISRLQQRSFPSPASAHLPAQTTDAVPWVLNQHLVCQLLSLSVCGMCGPEFTCGLGGAASSLSLLLVRRSRASLTRMTGACCLQLQSSGTFNYNCSVISFVWYEPCIKTISCQVGMGASL